MKALRRISKAEQRRIMGVADDIYDKIQMYIMLKFLALMCLAMNSLFGFGRKRLCRLVYQMGQNSLKYDEFLDIKDDVLYKRLMQIKMPELAEQFMTEAEKYREMCDD